MELWVRGDVRVPDVIFYQLVDLIIEDDLKRAAQDRRARPRPDTVNGAGAVVRDRPHDDDGSGLNRM